MLKRKESEQMRLELVTYDLLARPDHATISVNRKRRFRNNDIAEQIFQEILNQAQEKELVGSKILYTDSTHVKALANKHKKVTVTVTRTPKTDIRELYAAVAEERKKIGKKPFDDKNDPPTTGTIQQSKSDPDSGQLHKEGKPDGFHYSEHRTVDSRCSNGLDIFRSIWDSTPDTTT